MNIEYLPEISEELQFQEKLLTNPRILPRKTFLLVFQNLNMENTFLFIRQMTRAGLSFLFRIIWKV